MFVMFDSILVSANSSDPGIKNNNSYFKCTLGEHGHFGHVKPKRLVKPRAISSLYVLFLVSKSFLNSICPNLSLLRPSQEFWGFREKGCLFSGIWGEGSFIFRDLGRKHKFLGF